MTMEKEMGVMWLQGKGHEGMPAPCEAERGKEQIPPPELLEEAQTS